MTRQFGENNLSDPVEIFLSRIDSYLECKDLQPIKMHAECKIAESFTMEEVEQLTQDDCFNHAYMLYQYCNCLSTEKSRQAIALNWCNDALNKMVSKADDGFSQYTKHEMKMAYVINENHVAKKIDDWRATAEARVSMLENREYILRKQADCLMTKGSRK